MLMMLNYTVSKTAKTKSLCFFFIYSLFILISFSVRFR